MIEKSEDGEAVLNSYELMDYPLHFERWKKTALKKQIEGLLVICLVKERNVALDTGLTTMCCWLGKAST